MHANDRDEPALELRFSSAWTADRDEFEPDPASWGAEPEPFADELEGEPEFDIPTPSSDSGLSTDSWNLGPTLAAAAAFVPLLFAANPVLAAPPAAETAAPPIESAPTPEEQTAIWQALVERQVILNLHDETAFRGMVLSVSEQSLVCARESDGMVVLVDFVDIAFVQVIAPEEQPAKVEKPAQPGQGLIVLGSIATAIGGSLTIAALAVGGSCASSGFDYGYVYLCPYITAPLGAVGLANLAAGIPMLAVGLRRRADARAAAQQPTLSPFLAPNRSGAMAGFGMRF